MSESVEKPKEQEQLFKPSASVLSEQEIWNKYGRSMACVSEKGLYIAHSIISLNPPKFTRRIPTAGVAANKYGGIDYLWNPDFFSALAVEDIAFINAHEAHHVTAGHVYERMENHQLFNICADIIVNTWLMEQAQFKLSPELYDGLWHAAKINMEPRRLLQYASAVDLYNMFLEKKDLMEDLLKQYGGMIAGDIGEAGQGDDEPAPGSGQDGEEDDSLKGNSEDKSAGATPDEHQDWGKIDKSHVDNVIDKIKDRGIDTSQSSGYGDGGIFRSFEIADQNFDWEKELARFLGSVIRIYDSYERPHRRISPAFPDTVIPYTKQKEDHFIGIYVDVSGSIGAEELARFMGVIEKAPPQIRFIGFSFDTRVHEWDMKSKPPGGGGTSFHAVVEHAEKLPKKMDAYVVLTDGYDSSPSPKVPRKWMWVYTDAKLDPSAGHSVKMPALRSQRRRSF